MLDGIPPTTPVLRLSTRPEEAQMDFDHMRSGNLSGIGIAAGVTPGGEPSSQEEADA
jgi:hypothetical protein